MYLWFSVTVVLFSTFYSLSTCLEDGSLALKNGITSEHRLSKRDLSAADAELLFKTLMSKLSHAGDAEMMHKKLVVEKDDPGKGDKFHATSVKKVEVKHITKSAPLDYEYMKEESIPAEKSSYEIAEETELTEKDLMAMLMKIKQLSVSKTLDDPYVKDAYLGDHEKEVLLERLEASKGPIEDKSKKAYGEVVLEDKFNDKDVSLAESLYHMKIAGDVETYPMLKMANFKAKSDKKVVEEELVAADEAALHTDEAFLKKVDEIGKEETSPHLKEDEIEGYLKKAAEDKSIFYDPKLHHPEMVSKSADEKALEEWKASHKDIFAMEGTVADEEKLKMEGAHHIEGGIAHEVTEKSIKKQKTALGLDKELKLEGDHHFEEGVAHEISDEFIKKQKSAFGLDKELKIEDPYYLHGGVTHEINDEFLKKMKESLGLGKELFVEGTLHAEGGFAHEINDELMKKLKTSLGLEKGLLMGGAHPGVHHLEAGIPPEMKDELMKKLKGSTGYVKSTDEMFHESKTTEGSFAYEKAKEQAHKDAHIHLGEDELKKHIDETLSYEEKKKLYGTELAFDEGLNEKAYESFGFKKEKEVLGSKIPFEAESKHAIAHSTAHAVKDKAIKVQGDEIFEIEKTYGAHDSAQAAKEARAFDESFGFKKEKEVLGSKIPFEAESKHAVAHGTAHAVKDKAIKVQGDEIFKIEKTYGDDSLFHKEILEAVDKVKDEGAHILRDSEIKKHQAEAEAGKEHKTLSNLKAKFFELLRRVFHRKCHLVTMRPGELLGIVNCISMSKNPLLCEKFVSCEKKMPARVIEALEKCQKEIIPGQIKKCTTYAPLFPTTEIPLKIFQCMAIKVRELIPQEKKEMVEFEKCARALKAESCSRFKWLRGPH